MTTYDSSIMQVEILLPKLARLENSILRQKPQDAARLHEFINNNITPGIINIQDQYTSINIHSNVQQSSLMKLTIVILKKYRQKFTTVKFVVIKRHFGLQHKMTYHRHQRHILFVPRVRYYVQAFYEIAQKQKNKAMN